MTIPAEDQSMPGFDTPAAELESRASRRSAEHGGTLRPRRIPESAWAPPAPVASEAGANAAGAPEIERYFLCCEVPSGDFVEIIVAVTDGPRRRYFTTSDGARLTEVDEYYFVRRSLGDARSMLELDAREMAELEAELNFVRPVRGRDPLAELAEEEALSVEATEATANATAIASPWAAPGAAVADDVDATEDAASPVEPAAAEPEAEAPSIADGAAFVDEFEALTAEQAAVPTSSTPEPLDEVDAGPADAEPDPWEELLRRSALEHQERAEPLAAPARERELMSEPVLLQWAETINRSAEPEPEAVVEGEPEPAVEPESDAAEPVVDAAPASAPEAAPASLPAPWLTLVPEPPVVPPAEPPAPKLTLVPVPAPEASTAPIAEPAAGQAPVVVPVPAPVPTPDADSNEEINPVAMMTNPIDALAPEASVTPIAAPAPLSPAPTAVDPDAAAQVALAKGIAFVAHRGQVDRVGADYIDHPGRVAEHFDPASEPVATAAAWLHDVVERSAVSEQELLEAGVRPEIVDIVVLLTRTPGMSDDEYFARIRSNPLARRVKLADVADNSAPWRVRKLDYDEQQRLAAKYHHARAALA